MSKQELTPREYVYLGSTQLKGGGRGIRLARLEMDGTVGDEVVFKHRRVFVVGGVYEIPSTPDGTTANLANPTFKRLYPDQELRIQWEARDQAEHAALRALKLEKQSKAAIETAIEPVRRVYHRTDALGKLALELILLRALRKHPWLEKP